MIKNKLNLGCGHDIKAGWINLDSKSLSGVDRVHDVEQLPLPFESNTFDNVLAKDILEHVEYIAVLKDVCRILKPDGVLQIQVPHFTSVDNYIDPTHKKKFSIQTFEFFIKDSMIGRNYYFDFSYSKIKNKKISFVKRPFFYNYLIEKIVNTNDNIMNLYEKTGFCRIFPAKNICIELVK